jgi:putative ABC transport system permease protein
MIEDMAQKYFFDTQRQTMMIGLTEPQEISALEAFRHLPGVVAVEPTRIVGADFSVGTRKHRGGVTGVIPNARLQPVHDDASGMDIAVPPGGLVMSTRLAQKLGVGVGDAVWVDVQTGRRPSVQLPVTALFETLIAMPVYMDLDALNRLLKEPPSLEYANLLVDRRAEPALFSKLKTLPNVGAIMLKQAAIDSFYSTIGEHMLIYTSIFAMFAGALGCGVAYNSARIALSERGRELATRGLTMLIAYLLNTELYRIPVVIQPSTYGWAVVLTLAATAASAEIVRRRIDRLDLIRVLKTRE